MGLSPGARRSLGITASLLGGLTLVSLARDLGGPLGWAGGLARVWVFPHAGLRAARTFPDRPASLLPWAVALAVALVQWAGIAALLARWTRGRSFRAQVGWSLGALVGTGIAVLGLALALGWEIGVD